MFSGLRKAGQRRNSNSRRKCVALCGRLRVTANGYCAECANKLQGDKNVSLRKNTSEGKTHGTLAWTKDAETDACSCCGKLIQPISVLGVVVKTNKHHCRRCGQIVCTQCSEQKCVIPGLTSELGELRVCDVCFGRIKQEEKVQQRIIPLLVTGQMFRKHGRMGFPHERFVKFSRDLSKCCWYKPQEVMVKDEKTGKTSVRSDISALDFDNNSCMEIVNIKSVEVGIKTAVLKRSANKAKENVCFSIVGKQRTLDLESPSTDIRNAWVGAIKDSIEYIKALSPEERRLKGDKERATAERQQVLMRQKAERKKKMAGFRSKYTKQKR